MQASGKGAVGCEQRVVEGALVAFAGTLAISAFATTLLITPVSAAESESGAVTITVQPTQTYTDTGVTVQAGDSVTITATGQVHFGGGRIDSLPPTGIARGPECDAISSNQPRSTPWPAPALSCWSLIGKIKGGRNFEIGLSRTFQPKISGEHALGVNDNYVDDNEGSWSATIRVVPGGANPTTTPTTEPGNSPPPAEKKKKKSSSPLPLILGAIVVLGAGVVLFRFLAGRRGNDDDKTQPVVAPPLVPLENPYAAMANAPAAAPPPPPIDPEPMAEPVLAPVIATTPSASPVPESIDVNIYEVEFTNGLTLRVGYNHFPEGTRLNWKVTQNRIPVTSGHFVAKGGGSTNHVETVPLGVKLESRAVQPDGADVQFDWNINGVPFRYSVRRDPNC